MTKMTNFRAPIFLSTLSLRRATLVGRAQSGWLPISIHALLAESDSKLAKTSRTEKISIHALLAESDLMPRLLRHPSAGFLSTLSLRRATSRPWQLCQGVWNFYPRSPCGERPDNAAAGAQTAMISIHALLAESDWYNLHTTRGLEISIHALLAESDSFSAQNASATSRFLSTLSLRRATRKARICTDGAADFYPRSPCGERRKVIPTAAMYGVFLSTLSLRRATSVPRFTPAPSRNFYPRSPCGERQPAIHRYHHTLRISIHALLAESDPGKVKVVELGFVFLSTLSLRRATLYFKSLKGN